MKVLFSCACAMILAAVFMSGGLLVVTVVAASEPSSNNNVIHDDSSDSYEPQYRLRMDAALYDFVTREHLGDVSSPPPSSLSSSSSKMMTTMDVFVTADQLERLRSLRVAFEVAERSTPLRAKFPNYNMPDGYSDFDAIIQYLDDVARQFPTIAALVDMSQYGPGLSYEGKPFPALKISDNVTQDEYEPNILVVGNHHAREIVTPHLVMDTIARLTSGYASDAEIRSIVDDNEIFLIPTWNPDGYVYAWDVNNMWRKNRKPNAGGSYGVDQNRNYDLGWDSVCSGSSVPSSETYKGVEPHSEEETKTMVEFTLDRNLAKAMDFHSYGREVLHHYTCTPMAAFLEDYIYDESVVLADMADYSLRVPSGDGEHQQWTIARTTSYSFLVETCNEFQPSFEEAQQEAERVWPLTKHFLERTIPVSGRVLSASDSRPLESEIYVAGLELEIWRSDARHGGYHLFLPDGTYAVEFVSAIGTAAKTIVVDNNNPVVFDVYI